MPTLEALLLEYKGDGRDNSDSIDGAYTLDQFVEILGEL